jgi:hypothetical protein
VTSPNAARASSAARIPRLATGCTRCRIPRRRSRGSYASQEETGYAIEVEVWERPIAAFGSLVAGILPPLGVSTLELDDGTTVQGFLCEAAATRGADDISRFGGWRAFLDARATAGPMQRARLMRSRTVSARRCTSIRRSSDDQAFRSDCRFHRARHACSRREGSRPPSTARGRSPMSRRKWTPALHRRAPSAA